MTCRKLHRLIPLAAGDDLSPRQARAMRAHIARCPGCRAELEAFRKDLAAIRAEARAEVVADWSAGEWRALMVRVAAATNAAPGRAEQGAGAATWMRPRWAAAAVAGALLSLVIMAVLFKGPSIPRPAPEGPALAANFDKTQDKVAIHMVSPESGLQVVWILDRNFEWKGDHE
jgi:hypothetical protein